MDYKFSEVNKFRELELVSLIQSKIFSPIHAHLESNSMDNEEFYTKNDLGNGRAEVSFIVLTDKKGLHRASLIAEGSCNESGMALDTLEFTVYDSIAGHELNFTVKSTHPNSDISIKLDTTMNNGIHDLGSYLSMFGADYAEIKTPLKDLAKAIKYPNLDALEKSAQGIETGIRQSGIIGGK